ncbi:hypothetical protein DEU56DRAFT_783971 [Suillus clintonianus]|uniref:uncharacterized protein n=1 Tax=Suillus clintonianus TaxID=1904413 RepID=UPI001B865D89|nr:uncharacterized protein DEU56DRAFT_783971 [Suillus clintonianus]KAG2148063.1 hypothetical protein DEU56DRAFT_783971 [Suillus clintonianus]
MIFIASAFATGKVVVEQFRALGPLPTILLAAAAIVVTYNFVQSRKSRVTSSNVAHTSPVPEKDKKVNKNRELGEWTAEEFQYPEIDPCPFPLKDVRPVPYRPFRRGEYHITMGIRTMPWTEWIELDSTYSHWQSVRKFRVRTRGHDAVRVLPAREDESVKVQGGAWAAKELVYELAEYLPRRYPSSFRITRLPNGVPAPSIGGVSLAWGHQQPVRTIEAVETGEKFDLGVLEGLDGVEMGEEAMRITAGLIQEDVALMIEGTDGKYYFQAGAICIPGFWRMRDKIGMTLDDIHISGNVPQFKEKLQTSMERFFKRMPVDKPVIRNNYFIQTCKPSHVAHADSEARLDVEEECVFEVDPEELGWSESTNGPEDSFLHGHGHAAKPASYLAPSTLRLRSERQTLRRLPRTGAIVFGIRTYLFKIEELARERGVADRLGSAIRSWPEDVGVYKGRKMYRDVLLNYLDECAARDGKEEEGRGYPF